MFKKNQPEISSWRISGFCEICEKQKNGTVQYDHTVEHKVQLGYRTEKKLACVFRFLKNPQTWVELDFMYIVYLGAACDVASHLYSLRQSLKLIRFCTRCFKKIRIVHPVRPAKEKICEIQMK